MIQQRVNPIPGTQERVHWIPTAVIVVWMAGSTGCATHVWCNPGAPSAQAIEQAQYNCKTGNTPSNPRPEITVNTDPHALRTMSGAPVNASGVDPYEFKACMEKSGYHYVTQQQCDAMPPAGGGQP
jgi:hypothetical protein